jgi:hypothetical protein
MNWTLQARIELTDVSIIEYPEGREIDSMDAPGNVGAVVPNLILPSTVNTPPAGNPTNVYLALFVGVPPVPIAMFVNVGVYVPDVNKAAMFASVRTSPVR